MDDWLDQPYTDEDLKKPGFDPFEAHYAWLARRRSVTPEQRQTRIDAILRRVDLALAKLKAEQKKPKRKKKILSESERTLNRWKAALKEIRRQKS